MYCAVSEIVYICECVPFGLVINDNGDADDGTSSTERLFA